jgi:predicted nucleic acid-binding protein
MSQPDGQITSIAHAHGFAVATRNIKNFEGCGIELINPFEWDKIPQKKRPTESSY